MRADLISLRAMAFAAALMASPFWFGATAASSAEQDSPAPRLVATDTDLAPGLRIVCQRMPPPPGSRLGGRNICKTQADWDLYRREIRHEVQRMQDRSHF